jgi:hypothetical protein
MHPAALLIVWLCALLAIQFFSFSWLLALAALMAVGGWKVVPAWGRYVYRARWLLLALWLVLAYGAPGDALFDRDWLPTWAGIDAANLQALRLILMLGCLAWLFRWLGRDGLMVALLGLLWPLRRWWGDVDRLVVRLSLVLDHLKNPMKKGEWRQMLCDQSFSDEPQTMVITLPAWRSFDRLALGLLMAGLLAWVVL